MPLDVISLESLDTLPLETTPSDAEYEPRTDWLITDANGNVWTILQVIRELEGSALHGAFSILPAQKLVTLSPRNPTDTDSVVRSVRRPWTQQEAARFGEGVPNFGPEKAVFLLPGTGTGPQIYRCSVIKQQS
jgi:hypothetical protein